MEIEGFASFRFAHEDKDRVVYRRGVGPGVLLLHELPGMIPECIDLARRLADHGYTVFMPLFHGEPGQNRGILVPLFCLRREFSLFAANRTSPIATWFRALARQVAAEPGCGPLIGAIGMCLTAGSVLAMMVDDCLTAPVISSPALPGPMGPFHPASRKAALDVSPDELAASAERSQREEIPLLGFRFADDPLCPASRFETVRRAFGERFEAHVIPGNKHAVFTGHFSDIPSNMRDDIWRRLVGFLDERLKRATDARAAGV